MGQKASLSSSQMTLDKVKQLIHWRARLQYLHSLGEWANRNMGKLSKGKLKVLQLGWNKPMWYRLSLNGQAEAMQNSTGQGGAILVNKWNINQQQRLLQTKANHILGCISKRKPAGQGKRSDYFLLRHPSEVWSTTSSFELPSTKALTNWKGSSPELLRCLSRSPSD